MINNEMIQADNYKLILTYNNHQLQFCKRCATGEHMRALVNHLAPKLNLEGFPKRSLIFLEHQYYHRFLRGIPKQYIKQHVDKLLKEVEKRIGHIKK